MKRRQRLACLIGGVAVVAAIVAYVVISLPGEPGARAGASVEYVDEVPAVIPPQGAKIRGAANIVLMPCDVDTKSLALSSEEEAVAAAPKDDTPVPMRAILATVTIESSVPPGDAPASEKYSPIEKRPAWVVTYDLENPVDPRILPHGVESESETPQLKSHINAILDAETGEFLFGFYTE